MNDYDLIDIETKIFNDLSDSCDMNEEAASFISNSLNQSPLFGDQLIHDVRLQIHDFLQVIADYDNQELLDSLLECKTIMKQINLMSIKQTSYHSVVERFTYILTFKSKKLLSDHLEHQARITGMQETLKNNIIKSIDIENSFYSFLKQCIIALGNFDKKIILGKCIIENLRKYKDIPDKQKARKQMKKRVFSLELEKNIPMQIITRLQIINEGYVQFFSVFNDSLQPQLDFFNQKYRQIICIRQQQIRNPELKSEMKMIEDQDLDEILVSYHQILSDLRSLIYLKENLREKTADLRETLIILENHNKKD